MAKKPKHNSKDIMLERADDSLAMVPYWDLTDALMDGVDALREAGDKYLPMFADETATTYKTRKKLTKFTNIYRDVIEALSLKPFEKETTLIEKEESPAPKTLTDFTEDVDGSGRNLTMFAADVFFNTINSAIDWIFIDYPETDTSTSRTQAEARAQGNRPFWSRVLGRNVLKATVKIVAGEECLDYIRIYEPGDPDHVRVIGLDAEGVIWWELWEDTGKFDPKTKTAFIKIDDGQYEGISCIPMVPFMIGRREGRTFKLKPVMRDAADLSIELYQEESGLKHVKNLAAYPILTGNGVTPEKDTAGQAKTLKRGPNTVLYAPPNKNGGTTASWEYIQPNAELLKFLGEDIKETKQDLRELGRQPLTAQTGNLTVVTTQVAAGKAKSAVNAWALNLKNALEKAMNITAEWYDEGDYEPEVDVYTDFDSFIDASDYEVLQKMREAKDISYETYTFELKRRGLLSPEFNSKEEIELILADPFIEGDEEINDDNKKSTTED